MLLHRGTVDELHDDLRSAMGRTGPDGEAVVLALMQADAEVAIIAQAGTALLMTGIAQLHVMGTTLEGSVVLDLEVAEGLPPHQAVGELEGAVLD